MAGSRPSKQRRRGRRRCRIVVEEIEIDGPVHALAGAAAHSNAENDAADADSDSEVSVAKTRGKDTHDRSDTNAATGSPGSSLTHGEMAVQDAQRTAVVRVPGALSAAEVKQLLAAHSTLRGRCGVLRTRSQSAGRESVEGRGNWGTTYLHTNDIFAKMFPKLRQRIFDIASHVDRTQGWNLLSSAPSAPQLRCVELHTVGPGGSLPEQTHYDHGSLITVDILLSNVGSDSGVGAHHKQHNKKWSSSVASEAAATTATTKDFEGGDFCTLESNDELLHHASFEVGGDALVFVSHKYHCVQPVLSGQRQVLVAELWAGVERKCAHRCEYHHGKCPVTLALSRSADVSFLEYLSRFPHDPSGLLDRYPDGVMT